MLKKAVILAVLAIVTFAAVVAVRPAEFTITRSATLNAPPTRVFPYVNDLTKWKLWSPWAELDPSARESFEGPREGAGAVMKWSGNDKIGEGAMTILESRPSERILFRLEFAKPMKAVSSSEFIFRPEGGRTVVIWSMSGKNNFIGKAMDLVMNCDRFVGGQFEKGLQKLNSIVK